MSCENLKCFQVLLFSSHKRGHRFGPQPGAQSTLQAFLALGRDFIAHVIHGGVPIGFPVDQLPSQAAPFHLTVVKQVAAGPGSSHLLKTYCVHSLDVDTKALGRED